MLYYSFLSGSYSTTQITKSKLIYPLSLSEVKRHLRLDNDFVVDDDYLMTLISAATQMAENYIGKDIAQTRNTLRIDDFSGDFVKVYEGNFISVESTKDSNNTAIGTVKQTSKHDDYFQIEWTSSISSDPLTITFLTGFNENETTELIKQAILIKTADLYDSERSSYAFGGSKNTNVFETILNYYKSLQ